MKSMSIKPETLPKIKSSEVESFDSNNILYKLEFEGDISVEFMVMRNDRFGTFVKGKINLIDGSYWVANPSEVFSFIEFKREEK